MNILEPLKSVDLSLSTLPELCSDFRIPKLAEKPQNPIMDSLQLWNSRSTKPLPEIKVKVLEPLETDEDLQMEAITEIPDRSLWVEAVKHAPSRTNAIRSWDVLTHRPIQTAPAFLSERPGYTLAAARHIVLPAFQDEAVRIVNVLPSELFGYIQLTLSGLSSPLHVWDTKEEAFLLRGLAKKETGKLVITGLDHEESRSLVNRFVTIGTQMRRLEILISRLQDITTSHRKHLNALGYSLSSVLSSIKSSLAEVLVSSPPPVSQDDIHAINTLWFACTETAEQLEDLATLCKRGIDLGPKQYSILSQNAPELLTTLYEHLQAILENNMPRAVTAITAFILTSTSADYLEHICGAVGYSPQHLTTMKPRPSDRHPTGLFDDDPQEHEDLAGEETDLDETYPCFFSPQFAQGISRARRSLELLQIAKPDHPLLIHSGERPRLRWFWSCEEVEAAWLGTPTVELYQSSNDHFGPNSVAASVITAPESALQALRLFDLEPGAHLESPSAPSSSRLPNPFLSFQKKFPSRLPSVTPTLETLRDLVMSPLAAHIDSLSAALLDVFLSQSSGYLDFHRHLTLLRSYLLLTSHSFQIRLGAALFCDAPEPVSTESSARAMAVRTRRSLSKRRTPEPTADSWVVGLAPTLTEGSTWPPGGSDLSFYLRTVIIDSLEADYRPEVTHHDESQIGFKNEKDQLLEEAEWRLGFAIRDLPVGARARWLNPRSMEAMDFLYMNYHPPHPLDVLIPQSTLSKYHRIFAFNLRLMRVDNVTKALFRMTQQSSAPLFESLSSSRQLFLYFRFIASSFVTALSSYVYDTAIGGNFDTFLSSLASPYEREADSTLPVFSDVFALADHHSKVMDDILSACLLRSNQKAVGDLLRGALEIILDFGILMSDLMSGRMQEYEAAGPLEDLFYAFRRKMLNLHKSLKELIDKSASLSESSSGDPDIHAMSGSLPAVAASLHDLLTRVSIPQTWRSSRPTA